MKTLKPIAAKNIPLFTPNTVVWVCVGFNIPIKDIIIDIDKRCECGGFRYYFDGYDVCEGYLARKERQ